MLTAYQKVCTNPERQKADGMRLGGDLGAPQGPLLRNTKHHSEKALEILSDQLIRNTILKSWASLSLVPMMPTEVLRGF